VLIGVSRDESSGGWLTSGELGRIVFGVARLGRHRLSVVVGVVVCLGLVAAFAAAAATALPNPCTLLAKVHAEKTLGFGGVTQGKLTTFGSGQAASSTCSEKVGALSVFLTLSHLAGGFGGIKITSTAHPNGLGSGDELVVGTGPSGNPVDFIVFHKRSVFVDLSANGATSAHITTVARQIYKLLH
jgi:hypothetical protein